MFTYYYFYAESLPRHNAQQSGCQRYRTAISTAAATSTAAAAIAASTAATEHFTLPQCGTGTYCFLFHIRLLHR